MTSISGASAFVLISALLCGEDHWGYRSQGEKTAPGWSPCRAHRLHQITKTRFGVVACFMEGQVKGAASALCYSHALVVFTCPCACHQHSQAHVLPNLLLLSAAALHLLPQLWPVPTTHCHPHATTELTWQLHLLPALRASFFPEHCPPTKGQQGGTAPAGGFQGPGEP